MFQFLLGRLETANGYIIDGRRQRFQFLLGRLETAALIISSTIMSGFNSS